MTHILLLNATYEPLAVVTRGRALSLLMRGRVEPACADEVELRTVSQVIHIPTVIRLRYYVKAPRRGLRWSRRAVLQRDRHTCIYCGMQPGQKQRGRVLKHNDFTIDHILPVSRGGRNTWGNTACACPLCNQRKGNRTPHEANMKLRWEPKTPRVNYLVALGEAPAAWKVYLELPG
jgi:5-methylcytosine-specific restriction endonuclease McrA